MRAPTDLNSQIALRKGWTWLGFPEITRLLITYWHNPQDVPAIPPDYVGTLEGVAGLMRELNERELLRDEGCNFVWGFDQYRRVYYVQRHSVWDGWDAGFGSAEDHPGDCVGEAWLSEHKEAADVSSE